MARTVDPPTGAPGAGGTDLVPRFRSLRRYNVLAAVAHAAQAAAVVVLSNDFALPVTGTYLDGPPGTPGGEQVVLLDLPLGPAVAAFFALSALFHAIVASPWSFPRYTAGLAQSRNVFRWVEYSLSSTLMIVLIAQVTGITDVAALLGLAGANASMILFGWLQEKYHTPGDGGLLPFWFGCIAGVVPWLAILVYVVAPGSTSGAEPPGFVYGIVISIFLFFNVFALIQWLQYRRVGRFADYLVGERAYITASLVAKSLLAWQIFANTLIPT
ncbi:heliorhodopsin HeR [Actinotalea sp. Marseille-Q4924]|uniref:heliorhodopsin HeR n=1 Tax=Actinotalea sp. Marseille-Q4924 TaxID=2866571 RepID=UPI001CE42EEA|nr:heliorhodopsin HeR [Actinotalea sp. Marseille-Q4924]